MKKSKQKNFHYSKLFPLFILISTIFMGIGYASINSITGEINGTAQATPQDKIFITSASYSNDIEADINNSNINYYFQTMLNSKITLSKTNLKSSITYTITIYNSTDKELSFAGVAYDNDFYDNQDITFELSNLQIADKISTKEKKTFQITFKYKDDITTISNNILNSILNFKFVECVDYIESDGTQYIDTEIKPNNNTTFELSFSLTNVEENQAIYGTRIAMDQAPFHNLFFYKQSNKWELRWDDNTANNYIDLEYNEGKTITIKQNSNNLIATTNGKSVTIPKDSGTWSLDSSIHIFNIHQQASSETRLAKMRLYYLKIYQDGNLVRDFIPVLDNEETPCLFDRVSKTYFYNKGTGQFTYAKDYTPLDYIESSGTQYIKTGIKPSNNTSVEFVMSLNSVANETQGIFGGRNGQINKTFNMFWYASKIRWDYYSYINNPLHNSTLTKPTYYSVSGNLVTIDDTANTYNYNDQFSSDYEMFIFAVNDAGNAVFQNKGMKLYYFKIKNGNDTIANLIPVKDKNNVACLYDLISNKYIYNSGTGSFIFTE